MRTDECQIKLYVPDVARERKRSIDKLFMDFKTKRDRNFRYIVKNLTTDLEILVKSVDPNRGGPYRKIDIAILGAIPELNLKINKKIETPAEGPNEFTTVSSRRKRKLGKKASKERVFRRLERFLEMGEPMSDDEQSSDEMSS